MPVESLLSMIFKNDQCKSHKKNVTFKVLHQYMFDKELHYLNINEHTFIQTLKRITTPHARCTLATCSLYGSHETLHDLHETLNSLHETILA